MNILRIPHFPSQFFLFLLFVSICFPDPLHAQSLPTADSHPTTLIDDFEDPGRDASAASIGFTPGSYDAGGIHWLFQDTRSNLWGERWRLLYTSSNEIGVTYDKPGPDSNHSASITGTGSPGLALYQTSLLGWDKSFNAACHGLTGVEFWMKGDGNSYWVCVPDQSVTDQNWYGFTVTPPDFWTLYQIPFNQMRRRNVSWETQDELPEHPDGSAVIGFQVQPLEGSSFSFSLDQVAFYGSYVSTCSSPDSPAASTQNLPAPTPTPLGNGCPPLEVDDFENQTLNNPGSRTNLWGGQWSTASSPGWSLGVTYGGSGADGSRFCAGVAGSTSGGEENGYASLQTNLAVGTVPFDAAAKGWGGVQFWMKGDGQTYWFNLLSQSVTDTTGYSCPVTPRAGQWTFFQVPFKNMIRKSFWDHRSGPAAADGTNITGLGFMSQTTGPFSFSVDQIGFYCSDHTPVPTPTPTPTRTPTPVPFIPKPTSTFTPLPIPTWTPFIPKAVKMKPVFLPTSTPSTARAAYLPVRVHPLAPTATPKIRIAPAKPSPTPVALPPLVPNLSIVFSAPPANIDVTFADGPGRYQLEVVDSSGNSLEAIYDQTISYTNETWVEWDGRDSQGKAAPPGQYYAVLYKDGKPLRSISIVRVPLQP